MSDISLSYVLAAIPVLVLLWNWFGPGNLRHIPTIGTSIPGLAYLNGLRFIKHARELLQEGYDKHAYKGGVFKVAMPDQWLVLVAGPDLVDEVRKMPDDVLSLSLGVDELLSARYVLGANVVADPYHMPLIHAKLTRNLSEFYPALKDEMWNAFEVDIGVTDEWRSVPALKTVIDILGRTSNRVFVGLPLCRDPDFMSVAASFTLEVSKSRFVVNLFPHMLKGLVAKLTNRVPASIRRMHSIVGPMIEERRKRSEESSKTGETWDDRPNDMLMWLIDAAIQKGYSNEVVTQFLLVVEFTAMHTTAMSFTHALYCLAADPSLVAPLRQEVESVLASEGGDWGKGAVNKFCKIDSFLRESQRVNGINATTVWRKTLKPITFSTGVSVPAGVFLSVAATPLHVDSQQYDNAATFDPWRFVDAQSEKASSSQSFVSTSVDYVPFGHGRHACPGRHLASYQMKLMLAHIVNTYDISFESGKEGIRPENKWFGNTIIPEPTVHVMFRKRRS